MQSDIFILAIGKDQKYAATIAQALKSHGLDIWLDPTSLIERRTPLEVVDQALNSSKIILWLISNNVVNSDFIVDTEIRHTVQAITKEHIVIPVRIEPCHLPDMLSNMQNYDLFPTGDDFHIKIEKLANQLHKIISHKKVFISYRRKDSAMASGWLFEKLAKHFGQNRIFMDISAIQAGENFVEAIDRAINNCEVVIVMIGDRWLDIREESGHRRLDNPKDFVRLEIVSALKQKVRVIPVLIEGAEMPNAVDLPPDLKPLASTNAVFVTAKQFHHDVQQLIEAIENTNP